ncbi:MAG: sigma-70 family RNA polymerase sigma factor [Pirellulaceae bacterium]|nr:sigma-70 family RNA polymerase sigma factor [Pirellulaceae bacterium]
MSAAASNASANGAGASSISSTMLQGLRDQDAVAWSRLVKVLGPVVYEWCRRSGLQPSDAENVVQEVFLSVAVKIETFRREKASDTFRGWLWRITQNKIRNYVQRWKKHPDGAGGTDAKVQLQQLAVCESSDSEAPSDPNSDCLILHRVLESIREDFEHDTWQAFWRMAVQGHPSAEIAADLGMTQEAVRQAKRRVVRRLQNELDGIF